MLKSEKQKSPVSFFFKKKRKEFHGSVFNQDMEWIDSYAANRTFMMKMVEKTISRLEDFSFKKYVLFFY